MVTNNANRVHIGFFGRMNSGKSTLINAIAREEVAIVSSVRGTTTDPVYKPMEIKGLGAVRLIDTAGSDDLSELGGKRRAATDKAMALTDIAVIAVRDSGANTYENLSLERDIIDKLKRSETPYIVAINTENSPNSVNTADFRSVFGDNVIAVNAKKRENIDDLIAMIAAMKEPRRRVLDNVMHPGETAVLVMPQDESAPEGRLIQPQVTVIRELLDMGACAVCVTPDGLKSALTNLSKVDIVITDSQVFKEVAAVTPPDIKLTGFSVLLAAEKGDIDVFTEGAKHMDSLSGSSKILIAEACSHIPAGEDIGRVKIPRLLKKTYGAENIEFVNGSEFPSDLSGYDLVIHCGACMFNRKYLMNRVREAIRQGVPITNYGIAIAKMNGILDRITQEK